MEYNEFKVVNHLVVTKAMEETPSNYIILENFKKELKELAIKENVDIEFLETEYYGYEKALEMYCSFFTMQGIYNSWVWDNSRLSVHLHTKEEDRAIEEYWANK